MKTFALASLHEVLRNWAGALLAILAAVLLVGSGGFEIAHDLAVRLKWLEVVVALLFVAVWLAELVLAGKPSEAARYRRAEFILLAVALIALGLLVFMPDALQRIVAEEFSGRVGQLAMWLVRLFLFGCVWLQLLRAAEWILSQGLRAEILLAGSFLGIIVTGSMLLMLPNAMADEASPLSFADAIFTATSATCVTGLVVRDTGSEFSSLGQVIIMGLIQVGGLGIATFVALLSSFSKKTLPVSQMVAFRQLVNAPALGDLRRRILGIVLITLVVEALGALLLFFFVDTGGSRLRHLEWALFHSISAFCNAGFSLNVDNMESLSTNVGAVWTIMGLVVLGGLGFLVIPELLALIWRGQSDLLPGRATRVGMFEFRFFRLSNQSRLSLIMTAVLLVSGLVVFWVFEAGGVLRGLAPGDAFTASLFQSVSSRTAGFNTLPVAEFQNATLIFLAFLMLVGGCPVSTAGGIKTVTFAVLLLGLRSLVTGAKNIEAFGRSIPARVVFSALNVFLLYIVSAIFGMMALAWVHPEFSMRDVFFECFSALSTVGLSTGVTPQLGTSGKFVLCVLMFVGRIGPIAMVLSVFQSTRAVNYEFPEEEVVVG